MPTSDWLIGSYPNLEAQSLTVTTPAPVAEARVIAAGNYYLFDDLSTFDLMAALAAAILGHSVVSDCVVEFLANRRIRITTTPATAITWPGDNILRDLVGYTGNLASATTHTAPNVSPLLWSGGRPATTEARVGTDGIPVRDIAVGQSGPGTVVATSHNRYRRNTLIYRYVANARMWTAAEAGGEFFSFFDEVLANFRRFKLWRTIPEDDASSTPVGPADTASVIPSTGAYIYAPGSGKIEMPWAREFGFVDSLHPLTIPVVSCAEFT